jgi:hypothetical protein
MISRYVGIKSCVLASKETTVLGFLPVERPPLRAHIHAHSRFGWPNPLMRLRKFSKFVGKTNMQNLAIPKKIVACFSAKEGVEERERTSCGLI